jgi:hypothetical protein
VVNTKQVSGRCRRHFESLDDVVVEVRSLATQPTRQLGNWSLGQICHHLGVAMDRSTSADKLFPVPLYLRIIGPWIRRRVLTRGLPRGFQLPPEGAVLLPPPVTVDEGLAKLESGIAALSATTRRVPHPVFGAMNVDEWHQFHLRHAEMHLSFIAPVELGS